MDTSLAASLIPYLRRTALQVRNGSLDVPLQLHPGGPSVAAQPRHVLRDPTPRAGGQMLGCGFVRFGRKARLHAGYGNSHMGNAMSRWWARLVGRVVVALALVVAPLTGAQAEGVIVVPFPPFFNASPPPPRVAAPATKPAYIPQAIELVPPRPPPPGQCYTETTTCPLADQALVGHPCSCDTKTGRVAGRGLIPPSVSSTMARERHPPPSG
jgi:hypothetical protein